MRENFFRTALILGLVSAIGPFAVDMYLPALPSIGGNLGASLHAVQLSLMSFILMMSLTQLLYGPLSDIVGRKLPLYIGMSLFGLASIGCALAPNIAVLVGLRALQGVGAGAGVVIPRAVVRDLHTGPDAVRLMSLLMLVFSVSPILAPVTGSLVVLFAGWRGIFWVIAAAAALGLMLAASQLKETRPASQRLQSSWSSAFSAYGRLLRDRNFIGLVLIGAFGMSGFFIYLANSSFVIINYYGLSPTLYSFFFASNAAAFIGTAQFNHWLTGRFGLQAVIRVATAGFAATLLSLFAVMLAGVDRLAVMSIFLFVGYCFLGLIVPNATVLSLERHGPIAGTASALLGTLQMTVATSVMGLAGIFANGTPLPMIGGIAICALTAFGLAKLNLGPPPGRGDNTRRERESERQRAPP
ncbi:MAG TPA: multidrug effflux MFS transporter [Steroidobacteraceae bacterium]|nr:multidrug effflux MFS transporter [Steroidobacteraceae bacterium]